MCAAAAWHPKKTPWRLTPTMCANVWGETSTSSSQWATPALAQKMSSPPSSSAASVTSRAHSSYLSDPLRAILRVSDVVDGHISAPLRQREGDPAANRALACRAGDQRDLSRQLAQITTRSSPSTTRTS
jgi:hypothetical protein